jgi:DNA (cytosine-5)-methyltransferase 1
MRYASVCDGIGAAHVAWQPLGWECAWTSEIEPFPAAVVDHHWKLKNLGDMTKLTQEMLNECGPISLLCGGTPCQSFSVAGLRKGLEDPRGNLALRFTQLVGVLRPEWVVWENVPGVLSSGEGRDFGTFLGALAELGYGFAYRVLDAQWFGVAQRRRRVFVVAHARDWRRAAAVLFERESLFGNPPTRGAKGERVTGPIAGCSNGGGANGPGRTADDADSLIWRGVDQANSEVCVGYAGTLNCDKGQQGGIVAFKENMSTPDAAVGLGTTLQAENFHAVAYTKRKRAQSTTDDETWVPGEVSPTMSCFDQGDTRATTVVAFTQNCRDEVRQINGDGQIAGALAAEAGSHQTNYVAFDVHGTLATKGASMTDCHTALRARPPGQSEASTTTVVAFAQNQLGEVRMNAEVMGTVNTNQNASGRNTPMVAYDSDTIGTIRSNTRNNSDPVTEAAMHVMHGMAVRRLTPKECERLQGFPDGYTDVTYRNKPAADGPRYRALGNSMAVPVMAWIGQRIAEVEATDGTHP